MSKAVNALGGAKQTTGIATVSEVPLQGMITLRGSVSDRGIRKAIGDTLSVEIPEAGCANVDGDTGIAWMSPDELLILCGYSDAQNNVDRLNKALGKAHALVVNVSDARASFTVEGTRAREVLAKLCPVDFAPGTFAAGMFRRTRMAQVPAALWLAKQDCIQIICFRSQAQYVFDLLCIAAQPGSSVEVF